ncbi:MAG: amino acid ABC transporter permease [Rhodospirillales bacterium]|nr:amino acid ABC transporter permease [Rhodospirillales bacterium]
MPAEAKATPAAKPQGAWWNDVRVRGILYQVVIVAAVLLAGWYLVSNTLHNLAARNIATGFSFLEREASFGISEHVIEYSPADSYGRAITVGLLNTLKVSLVGIVLATLLGTLVGIARLSSNWLVAKLATLYVEGVRNVPLLLQLFFWYTLITEALPGPRQSLNPLPGIFLNNRGLRVPSPVIETGHLGILSGLVAAIAGGWILALWARQRQVRTGRGFPVWRTNAALLIGLPLLGFLAGGARLVFDMPALKGFNFSGGATLTPEITALLAGLVVYTATFIAEIVRGGILSVAYGQTEAALALGLRRSLVMRLVLLPQALRVIVPPLTSQYLNLAKNSSLAVAIGYPDLVSVANTAINQTGQAIEGVAIIMGVFLAISLSISAFMNWYNRRIALQGGR